MRYQCALVACLPTAGAGDTETPSLLPQGFGLPGPARVVSGCFPSLRARLDTEFDGLLYW